MTTNLQMEKNIHRETSLFFAGITMSWLKILPSLLRYTLGEGYNVGYITCKVGRDSSAGTATRYGLDGPGSNPGGGKIFRTHPDRSWAPPSLLYNASGVKLPGCGVNHPPHLAPMLKKEWSYTFKF